MITLELYQPDRNLKYLEYDPAKWIVTIIHHSGGLDVNGMTYDAKQSHTCGYFREVHIRTNPIPKYISKSDIEVWD